LGPRDSAPVERHGAACEMGYQGTGALTRSVRLGNASETPPGSTGTTRRSRIGGRLSEMTTRPQPVEPGTLTGLWRRSLIIWPDGRRDETTDVAWLQGERASIDLRQPAGLPGQVTGDLRGGRGDLGSTNGAPQVVATIRRPPGREDARTALRWGTPSGPLPRRAITDTSAGLVA
jgi:hypothetical protein